MKVLLLTLVLASAGARASTDYLFQLQQVDFGSTAEGRLVLDQAPGAGMTTFSVADGTLLHVDFFYDPTAPASALYLNRPPICSACSGLRRS